MRSAATRARIGIDLGGTKIAGIALAPDGAVRASLRRSTPRQDYEGTLAAIAAVVAALEAEAGPATVGVGIPGSLSAGAGLVRNANSTWLNGRPLGDDLGARLGREVRIENDANCLAVSEAVDGAGAGAAVVWALILGTGVGSGIALDGRVLAGRLRIAGEWGHNPLPRPTDAERPGPECWCGRRGCNETFLSGPGFAADHLRHTGRSLSGEAVIEAFRAGDAAASETVARYVDRLGRGIAEVVNVLDPDCIVLGGGLSNVEELYARLPAAIAPHVFADGFDTPIRKSRHGDASGVRGAAWLWGPEDI